MMKRGGIRSHINVLSFAIVSGTREISETLAMAAFLFAGSLSAGYELAGTLFLCGAIVTRLAVAFFSRLPNAVGGPQEIGMAVIAGMLAGLPAAANPEVSIATALAICGATSVLTGVIFLLVGEFRLAHLARLLPYPVLAGFLAGSGWLLFSGGFTMVLGAPPGWEATDFGNAVEWAIDWTKLSVLLPALLLAVTMHMVVLSRPQATLAVMAAAALLFYIVLSAFSIDIAAARDLGWLPATPSSGAESGPGLEIVTLIDWSHVLSAVPLMLAAAGLSTLGMLLTTSGLSLKTRTEVDVNKELRGQGAANIALGMFGGLAGFVMVGSTVLANRFGVSRLAAGVPGALVILLGVVFAGPIVSYMPNFILAGIIIYTGLDLLLEWVYESRRRLPLVEWCLILLILFVVIFAGILNGIIAGIALSVAMFVYNYAKLPVIRLRGSVQDMRSNVERSSEDSELLGRHGQTTEIFALQGYLFFATVKVIVDQVRDRAEDSGKELRFVVMDFANVSGCDSAAVSAFSSIINLASKHGFVLIFAGMPLPVTRLFELSQVIFIDADLVKTLPDLDHAIEYCEEKIISEKGQARTADSSDALSFLRAAVGEDEAIADLAQSFETIDMKKGEYLIRRGEAADDVFVVLSGRIRVQIELPDGRTLRLRTMTPGAIVGDIAFYTGQRRTADVVVDEDSTLMRVSAADLRRIEETNGALASQIHRLFAKTLAEKLILANNVIRLSRR
jgi:sulfate permease, SulP family